MNLAKSERAAVLAVLAAYEDDGAVTALVDRAAGLSRRVAAYDAFRRNIRRVRAMLEEER